MIDIWRQLRKPFTLPCNSKSLHVCQWEHIDTDLVACKLCGEEHLCGSVCDHAIITDDGKVCEITGICVSSKTFADSEYTDTVNVYKSEGSVTDHLERRVALIRQYIHELLLSNDARRVSELQRKRSIEKYHQDTIRHLKEMTGSEDRLTWLDIVQRGTTLYQTSAFDESLRQTLANKCLWILQRVICTVTMHLDLRLKDSELRGFVFGLMFLMRSGVCMQGIQILPCCHELKHVLPSEAFMIEFRLFKAKYITDTENRFKFVFRHQSKTQISSLFNISTDY